MRTVKPEVVISNPAAHFCCLWPQATYFSCVPKTLQTKSVACSHNGAQGHNIQLSVAKNHYGGCKKIVAYGHSSALVINTVILGNAWLGYTAAQSHNMEFCSPRPCFWLQASRKIRSLGSQLSLKPGIVKWIFVGLKAITFCLNVRGRRFHLHTTATVVFCAEKLSYVNLSILASSH